MDEMVFYTINGLAGRSDIADETMLALTRPDSFFIPVALVLGCWLWLNRREALIGTMLLTGLIVMGDLLGAEVKDIVGRIRPCHLLSGVHQIIGCGGAFSFPSNHALNTATVAAFAQVLYPATGWVAWPLVAMVGFSRVYVGAHYVSDVLGGWAMGAALGTGAAIFLLHWSVFRPTGPA